VCGDGAVRGEPAGIGTGHRLDCIASTGRAAKAARIWCLFKAPELCYRCGAVVGYLFKRK
jgi:hypothetical protein